MNKTSGTVRTLVHDKPEPARLDSAGAASPDARHDWSSAQVEELLALPISDLMFRAQQAHRLHFDANRVQVSTLLSIKTGGCPEDCTYCPESARYYTGIEARELMDVEAVVAQAKRARD